MPALLMKSRRLKSTTTRRSLSAANVVHDDRLERAHVSAVESSDGLQHQDLVVPLLRDFDIHSMHPLVARPAASRCPWCEIVFQCQPILAV